MQYDLIVIGSGPAGQKGAIAAAKLGKRVAIVERSQTRVGGVCLHTGTVPSKTMREAILFLTGYRQKDVYADRYSHKRHITMDDLRKLNEVVTAERNVILDQLERNYIDVFQGEASFLDPHTIAVSAADNATKITAERILIASGSKPSRPKHIPFDGQTVFDSDEILTIDRIPRSMIIIGGGVIGIEYGIMFAALGVKITVVDGREKLLEFCDREIVEHLMYCTAPWHYVSAGRKCRGGRIDQRQSGVGRTGKQKTHRWRDRFFQRRPSRRHRVAEPVTGWSENG